MTSVWARALAARSIVGLAATGLVAPGVFAMRRNRVARHQRIVG